MWHCLHLHAAAVEPLLPVSCAAVDRYLLPTGPTAANPPQQSGTDRWTPDSCIDLLHVLCGQWLLIGVFGLAVARLTDV